MSILILVVLIMARYGRGWANGRNSERVNTVGQVANLPGRLAICPTAGITGSIDNLPPLERGRNDQFGRIVPTRKLSIQRR